MSEVHESYHAADWGEPVESPVPPHPMGSSITVRFAPAEHARIRAAARARGLTYSHLVRAAVAAYTQPALTVTLALGQVSVTQPDGRMLPVRLV